MSDVKFTMPPMVEGQDSWRPYINPPPIFTAIEQSRWRHAIYRVLMWASYRAEAFWHWTYHKAQPFGPIRIVEPVEPRLYGFISGDGMLTTKEPE